MRELKRDEEMLPCVLSPSEVRDRGMLLAQLLEELDEAQAALDLAKSKFKGVEAEIESRISETRSAIATKAEKRLVEVIVYADDEHDRVVTVREDTGEEIRKRPFTDSERNLDMFRK